MPFKTATVLSTAEGAKGLDAAQQLKPDAAIE
jgi:hypothetical protein